jgi:hypothetical protein
MRDTLLIGHANPEDNYFTLWLNSHLINEGYNVYCDLKNLHGGEEDFWQRIQQTIKEKTIKYILVLSHNTFNKQGVKDEWEYARSIAQEFNLQDFIIPLRIDDVPYNERIGLNRINIIDFSETWREGYLKLIKKLNTDAVPKTATQNSVYELLKKSVNVYQSINDHSEKYYTNILSVDKLPEYIYAFKYHHSTGAEAVRNECNGYPVSVNGNLLFSFEEDIPTVLTKRDYIELQPQEKFRIKVMDALSGLNIISNFEIGDPLNSLKVLLRNAFRNFMYSKGLLRYEMSNKKFCYYYKINTIKNNKFSYIYQGKKKTKNLIGGYGKKSLNPLAQYETKEHFWHFGITSKVITVPFLSYSVKTHILFSDNGETIWESDSKLHSARRDKCKMWHNAEWREILLAYLYSLGNSDMFLEIPVTKQYNLKIPCQPVIFNSNVGYVEPGDFERMFLLRNEREEAELVTESEDIEDVEQ